MSNPDIKEGASLIKPDSIEIESSRLHPVTTEIVLPKLSHEVDLDIDSVTKSRNEQAFLRAHHAKGGLIANACCAKTNIHWSFW
ncbi:MAG: hypothetical protein IPN42_04195 [Methylococcaceae bacterium]|nr:hypothetical protein [Methylococcaceae bacterium]